MINLRLPFRKLQPGPHGLETPIKLVQSMQQKRLIVIGGVVCMMLLTGLLFAARSNKEQPENSEGNNQVTQELSLNEKIDLVNRNANSPPYTFLVAGLEKIGKDNPQAHEDPYYLVNLFIAYHKSQNTEKAKEVAKQIISAEKEGVKFGEYYKARIRGVVEVYAQ